MKFCCIVALMNLSSCQGLSHTAVSPPESAKALRVPKSHRGFSAYKASSGAVLWKDVSCLRWSSMETDFQTGN